MVWVVDLDGVVWLARQPIPGSIEALARVRAAGRRLVLCTNNATLTVAKYRARLTTLGLDCNGVDLVTAAQAAASLVPEGATALVLGGSGVIEALRARHVAVVDPGDLACESDLVAAMAGDPEAWTKTGTQAARDVQGGRDRAVPRPDAVVVGWDRDFNLVRLAAAQRAVRDGARLIGTNEDATYPTPGGLLPGSGAFLAAVEAAAGVRAEVAGKPHQPMVDLLVAAVGNAGDVELVVGDRLATDGLLAQKIGAPFGLVLSGVTSLAGPRSVDGPPVARQERDLASMVEAVLGPTPGTCAGIPAET